MMPKLAPVLIAALLVLAAACSTIPNEQLAGTFVIRPAMQQRLNPAVLSIRQAIGGAITGPGTVDPALLTTAQWQQLAEGAEQLALLGHDMARARDFVAAPPENSQVRPGELSMTDIQQKIDDDPYLFRQMSADLAAHADKLAAAARARDGLTTRRLLAREDEVCASCHAKFWRPD